MDFDQYILEKEHVTIQQVVDRALIDRWVGNDPRFIVRELSHVVDGMAFQLSSYILKQQTQTVMLEKREVTASVSVQVPASWWDGLKATLKARWPLPWLTVKWSMVQDSQTIQVRATTDVVVVYPKLRLAFPEETLVVPRMGPIEWKIKEVDSGMGR